MDPSIPRSRVALFESLVEFSPDALLVADGKGEIVFANATAERLFGFEKHELLNTPIERLVPQRLRDRHVRHRHTYAHSPQPREMGARMADLVATRRDGSEFPVEIRLSPIVVDGESLVAAAVRDVTDRRHAAQALRNAQEEADRANAAKSRFLAAASHDLRQPLQTLQLLNGALQKQVDDPMAQELVTGQQDALGGMSRLLNALLDISKLEAGNIEPDLEEVSVVELFEALRREFESIAAARGLEFSVEPTPHYIKTDRTLFRQLLENLLANAIKYTEAGSVSLYCRTNDARPAAPLLIAVADTGIGIAPEQLGSVFEEFYQIARKGGRRQGVGLGLAIVKRIVNLLGVSIDVQSQVGRGSEFRVTVPPDQIADLAPVQGSARTSNSRAPSAAGAMILLVEDDDAVRSATQLYLKAIGYRTIAVDSIAAAEHALQSPQYEPDLIVTDYHLGQDETGIDLIHRIRARSKKVLPALLLSGDTSTVLRELTDMPSCRLLSKPVDVEVLNSAIAELLQ